MSTTIEAKTTLSTYDDDPFDAREYISIVRALQYLTFIRPYIQYAVNRACQNFHSPINIHLKAVKRILRYLKGTLDYGMRFLEQSDI